ncbi:MAG: Holliday junction resolvase RuvX [Gammaproteobacteria bacterium]
MAFDFGTHRIGVAIGQSLTGTAQAVCVLKARDGKPDWDQVQALIEEWRPDVFVVGLPYNMDGSECELLALAKKFANRIKERFSRPCYGMDERLSSVAAIEQVIEEGGTLKKSKAIDDIAAQIILENWFGELGRQASA